MNNQSELHCELTRKTAGWLEGKVTQRGLRWMQEFTLVNGLRPDAVAFCSLQEGEFRKFTTSAVDWVRHRNELKPMLYQYNRLINDAREQDDRSALIKEKWEKIAIVDAKYNIPENDLMFAFETKATKSDYDGTFKYDNHRPSKLEPFANFHLLVLPKDFTKYYPLERLPDWYGILEKSGRGLRLLKYPTFKEMDKIEFYSNAYNMLFRLERQFDREPISF